MPTNKQILRAYITNAANRFLANGNKILHVLPNVSGVNQLPKLNELI
jgi:hypothetical protein